MNSVILIPPPYYPIDIVIGRIFKNRYNLRDYHPNNSPDQVSKKLLNLYSTSISGAVTENSAERNLKLSQFLPLKLLPFFITKLC